jgi:prepilin-type N-terminal cleavage/methylation domain-containing protein
MQNVNCKLQTGNCREAIARAACPQPRRGVTLIELLVVIMIIALLAALVLGVAALAGETAREAQTKHTVQRLHTLLMDYYGTFKTRRVRLNPAIEASIDNDSSLNTPAKKGRAKAQARLYALRELMVMEVPDRWSDILLNAVPPTPTGWADALKPIYLDPASLSAHGRTDLSEAYLRRYFAIAKSPNRPTAEVLTDNQGAECLYMVIMLATGDGEARTLFAESNIGDTDGDGAPEFLDGWGHPINFLRWAPGFESPIQLDANQLGLPTLNNATWIKAANADHDPYDLFRVDSLAFRLVPLIYSGGRDETFGIRLVKPYVTWTGYATRPPNNLTALNPYVKATDPSDSTADFLGTPNADGTATDNVHNHLLDRSGKLK